MAYLFLTPETDNQVSNSSYNILHEDLRGGMTVECFTAMESNDQGIAPKMRGIAGEYKRNTYKIVSAVFYLSNKTCVPPPQRRSDGRHLRKALHDLKNKLAVWS